VKARRGVLYLANLAGTEPGKVRPVLVIQTDLLNDTRIIHRLGFCPVRRG